MENAFAYVQNNGICNEKDYPYVGQDNKCQILKKTVEFTGYIRLPQGDENALKMAVSSIGLISIAVILGKDFQHYKNGIYEDKDCGRKMKDLCHGLLLIGYGTENGKDYWLVKNS